MRWRRRRSCTARRTPARRSTWEQSPRSGTERRQPSSSPLGPARRSRDTSTTASSPTIPEFVARFLRPLEDAMNDEYSLIGTPDKVAEGVQAYVDIGADQIICLIQAGRIPHEDIMASLRLFGEEVMPRFK